MDRIAQFEKVSLKQFYKDIVGDYKKYSDDEIVQMYENIKLPIRKTTGSCGFDFFAPFDFTLSPEEVIKIPTGIRASISKGWFLQIVPRSGLGFKYYETLANSLGIVDLDYFSSDNEGHIFVKLVNRFPSPDFEYYRISKEEKDKRTMVVNQGQGFVQGIFLQFGITIDDVAGGVRNGGFGSTDK